jgi:hypothetical protein
MNFLDKAVTQWVHKHLIQQDYRILGEIEPVRIMPWSAVYRLLTSQGYIYLKQMSPVYSVETKVLNYLSEQFSSQLPKIIGINEKYGCFLMLDAGSVLRPLLQQKYQMDLVAKALKSYVAIQQGVANNMQDLLSLGIPNWQLLNLPQLYQGLMSKRDFLSSDGLQLASIEHLHTLYPRFTELCDQLSQYKIPETIEHCDFQDNNILVQDHRVVISDWGDTVISHPFFSLVSFLNSAVRNHTISDTSHLYFEIRDAYLNCWIDFESWDRLLKCFELAKQLEPIKFAANFYRVTLCTDQTGFAPYQGVITKSLENFIKYFK